jgi:hypothetical protein
VSFTTQRLTGGRALIAGTDVNGVTGNTVVSTEQWDEIAAVQAFKAAEATFDAAVAEINAPLTAALEAFESTKASIGHVDDAVSYVDLEPEVEGVPAQPGNRVKLNRDSIVLRLVEKGDTSRLVWVNDELEILAASPAPITSVVDTDAVLSDVNPALGS